MSDAPSLGRHGSFPTEISQAKDRITKMLTGKNFPSFRDMSMAASSALNRPGRSYGEALNEMRAYRLKEESTLYDLLSKERTAKRQERVLSLDEQKFAWQKLRDLATAGDEKAAKVWSTYREIGKDLLPKDRARLRDGILTNPKFDGKRASVGQLERNVYALAKELGLTPGGLGAPKMRQVKRGLETITEQWNPRLGIFQEISRAPTFKPSGGVTPAQQASNAKIDEARRWLFEEGMSREEILRSSQKQTDIGEASPDYNPFIASMARLATQRKVGDDPAFREAWAMVHGEAQHPLDTPPPGGYPKAELRQPEQPGLFERFTPKTRALLGGKPTARAPAADTPPSQYVAGRIMTMGGKRYKVIRRRADGSWIVQDKSGQYFKTQGAP